MSSSLSRRTSLVDYISSLPIRPRLASLRSRKSAASSNYTPYAVYQQIMAPAILRDADATAKLLEYILDSPNGRRALSRLARTCKAFQEPALNVLWRDLDSVLPLISLFPSGLLRRVRRPGLGLAKTPETDDWNRVLAYGERVRSIAYSETVGNVSPTIFPVFENSPCTYILPNLKALTWKVETAAGLERCLLFLSPELESFTLEVSSKPPRLNAVLTEVASRPHLKAFSFVLHTNLPDEFTNIFEANVGLERLALTAPGALSSKIGKWAGALPALQSFQLDLTGRTAIAVEGFFDEISMGSGYSTPSSVGGTDSGVFSGDELDFSEMRKSAVRLTRDGPRQGAFKKLNSLHLTGEASNIAMFLKHLASPLVQLDLVIEDPLDKYDWHEVCTLICEQFSETLQSLRISATSASRFSELVRSTSRGGDAPMRHLPLEHFRSLPHLIRLEIDLPESVIFHNSDIVHLARVFPKIEILKLCPLARFPQGTGPPFLTLEGIAPLTTGCKRLHTLGVVVNALEATEAISHSWDPSSRSLLRLQVGHSWVKDPFQAAILLSHLAPHLEVLKWFHEKNRASVVEANALAWQKVEEFLPYLQNIRLVERSLHPKLEVRAPPATSDKEVDATVATAECGMWASPEYAEGSAQASPAMVDISVQIIPEYSSTSVDATPSVVDEEVLAIAELTDSSINACPDTDEKEVGVFRAEPNGVSQDTSETASLFTIIPSVNGIISLPFRAVRVYTYFLSSSIRFLLSFTPSITPLTSRVGESGPRFPGGMESEFDESDAEKRIAHAPVSPSSPSEQIVGH